ncbi:MAG: translation initiation factor IF-1 [Deltaproteobacteria bacterium]|nr:translation initiation factor IF-1 [Deltaproteobacteria bacterium]
MPRALYAIRCEDGRCVLATLGETMRRVIVGLRPGDRVQVEISPRDPARGRVTAKM